jgi:hypothetical protein
MKTVSLLPFTLREHKSTESPFEGCDFTPRHKGPQKREKWTINDIAKSAEGGVKSKDFDYLRIDPLGRLGASRPPAAGNGRTANDVLIVI